MHLEAHVAQVQDQLAAAAALGDDRTREIAETLATAAAPSVRLAVLDAVSAATDEITAALLDYPGSPAVTIHLDGDEISVEVRTTTAAEQARPDDTDTNARISLRLGESLKTDIDSAAERAGVSVNTWLVRAASVALSSESRVTPLGGFTSESRRGGRHDSGGNAHRITGWING